MSRLQKADEWKRNGRKRGTREEHRRRRWMKEREKERGRQRRNVEGKKREEEERKVHVNGRWRQWAKERRERRRRNSLRTESIGNKPIATCTEVRVQISARSFWHSRPAKKRRGTRKTNERPLSFACRNARRTAFAASRQAGATKRDPHFHYLWVKDAVARGSSYERCDKRDTRNIAEKAEKGSYSLAATS